VAPRCESPSDAQCVIADPCLQVIYRHATRTKSAGLTDDRLDRCFVSTARRTLNQIPRPPAPPSCRGSCIGLLLIRRARHLDGPGVQSRYTCRAERWGVSRLIPGHVPRTTAIRRILCLPTRDLHPQLYRSEGEVAAYIPLPEARSALGGFYLWTWLMQQKLSSCTA